MGGGNLKNIPLAALYTGGYPLQQQIASSMNTPSKKGRHCPSSVQLKAWVPTELRADFAKVCAARGLTVSSVLRGLLLAYVSIEGASHD